MTFRAKNTDGKDIKLYDISNEYLRNLQKRGYICPLCDSDLQLVAVGSKFIRVHFRHIADLSDCSSSNKSELHINAQLDIRLHLKKIYKECTVELEETIWLEDGTRRQIDIAVINANGEIIEAHEVQLSAQSVSEFERRTNEYASKGIQTIWWIYGATDTKTNKDWISENCGWYGTFSKREKSVLLEEWHD
jgi:competence CoiA-like predicted nuclease